MRNSPWQQCHHPWNRFHLLVSKRHLNFPFQQINKFILTFVNMKSYTFSRRRNKLHNRKDTVRVLTLHFVRNWTACDVQFFTPTRRDQNWFLRRLLLHFIDRDRFHIVISFRLLIVELLVLLIAAEVLTTLKN